MTPRLEKQAADIIFRSYTVIPCSPGLPRADSLAVLGDKVLLVGAGSEMEQVIGPQTRVVDCRGRTIIPGFNDAHCHIFSFIKRLFSLDLSRESVSSIADIQEVVGRQAAATPPGTWIRGEGYNEFYLAEKRHPNRWDLDRVTPGHPVILSHRSLHACVLNSLALSLAGISINTEDLPGACIERDPGTGEPTGLLLEMLGYLRSRILPSLSPEEVLQGIDLVNENYLSNGITSLQDATVTNDIRQWQTFRSLKDSGRLLSRLSVMHGAAALPELKEAGLLATSGDSHLHPGGIKIILSETGGQIQPSQDELNRTALSVHQAGFQIAIHAITRSCIESAVSALEYIDRLSPVAGRRHRIEHCSECTPDFIRRLHRVGAVVASQPSFIYYSGERYLSQVSPPLIPWLYPFNSLIAGGLILSGSSDSPVVPADPLMGLYAAVTRRAASGQTLSPPQSISAAQALELYTVNAAYSSFEEKIKGSLSAGKLADLVVLSHNPLEVPPEQIKDIRVEMTVIGGQVVWER